MSLREASKGQGALARVVLGALALGLAPVACRKSATTPAAETRSMPRESAPAPGTSAGASAPGSRLPEDPVLGKQSEAQWQKHMDDEERERQLGYDSRHAKEHRALVALIGASRKSYDRATSAAQVEKAREAMARRVEDIKKRVDDLDHWGVNSRLLPDYAALEESLTGEYPAAKLAALEGEPHALETERARFDQHLENIHEWLEQATEEEEHE